MSLSRSMRVSLRLPTRLLFEGEAVSLQAVAENGAFGMLPNHADHVASLVPSILVLRGPDGRESFFGIDHGLLVKWGHQVDISIQRGVQGDDLDTLSGVLESSFKRVDETERVARTALSRLEIGILRHFSDLRKPAP
ncbi:F0F1 ATP synthase subunit epsilon [Castellaniella sp.]|uniref:F0F1 ATP synthase subunit epsilon n=1 Tax=Castellaniella sp. TaxID=1955812 RepID=UPI0035632987